MTSLLGIVQLTICSWVLVASMTALVAAAVYPRMRSRIHALRPEVRASLLSRIAAAPAALGTLLTVGCFVASLLARLARGADHCEHHADRHAHFCWVHGAPSSGSVLGWSLVIIFTLTIGIRLVRRSISMCRGARAANAILACSRSDPPSEHRLFDCDLPFALTVGFWSPRVILSTGLLQRLPIPLLNAVLIHESAHVARNDNLRKGMAEFFACLHGPCTHARLATDLALACEQACDQAAAVALEDPVLVAEAIVIAKRFATMPPQLGWVSSSFYSDAVTERVEALLSVDNRRVARTPTRPVVWLLALFVAALASAPLHDVLETLVSFLGS